MTRGAPSAAAPFSSASTASAFDVERWRAAAASTAAGRPPQWQDTRRILADLGAFPGHRRRPAAACARRSDRGTTRWSRMPPPPSPPATPPARAVMREAQDVFRPRWPPPVPSWPRARLNAVRLGHPAVASFEWAARVSARRGTAWRQLVARARRPNATPWRDGCARPRRRCLPLTSPRHRRLMRRSRRRSGHVIVRAESQRSPPGAAGRARATEGAPRTCPALRQRRRGIEYRRRRLRVGGQVVAGDEVGSACNLAMLATERDPATR